MAQITYADKDDNAPKGSPKRQVSAADMNMIKNVVNANEGGGGGGSGTVTSVSGFTPLFTVTNPTTTPQFVAVDQNPNLFYGGPVSGPAAAPTFRVLTATDLPVFGSNRVVFGTVSTGVPTSSSSFLYDDSSKILSVVSSTGKIGLDNGGGLFHGMQSGGAGLKIGSVGSGGGAGFGVDFMDNGNGTTYVRFLNAGGGSYAFNTSTTTNATVYILQNALSSAHKPVFRIDPGAHTAIGSTNELIAYDFSGANFTWAAGTIPLQRFVYMRAFTVTTGLATNAYGLYVEPPTGNITNPFAIYAGGKVQFTGSATLAPLNLGNTSGGNPTTLTDGDVGNYGSGLGFFGRIGSNTYQFMMINSVASQGAIPYAMSTGFFKMNTSVLSFNDATGVLTVGGIILNDATNVAVGTTTGTKFALSTSQKMGWWNATPIVQPNTGITAATFVANAGSAVNDASTFDGYTIGQVVKALRNMGKLA